VGIMKRTTESSITFEIQYPDDIDMSILEQIAAKLDEVFNQECLDYDIGELDHSVLVSIG